MLPILEVLIHVIFTTYSSLNIYEHVCHVIAHFYSSLKYFVDFNSIFSSNIDVSILTDQFKFQKP